MLTDFDSVVVFHPDADAAFVAWTAMLIVFVAEEVPLAHEYVLVDTAVFQVSPVEKLKAAVPVELV
jgi:hypothetical protein